MENKNLCEHVDMSTIERLKQKYIMIISAMGCIIFGLVLCFIFSIMINISFCAKLAEITKEVTELGMENLEMQNALDYYKIIIDTYEIK